MLGTVNPMWSVPRIPGSPRRSLGNVLLFGVLVHAFLQQLFLAIEYFRVIKQGHAGFADMHGQQFLRRTGVTAADGRHKEPMLQMRVVESIGTDQLHVRATVMLGGVPEPLDHLQQGWHARILKAQQVEFAVQFDEVLHHLAVLHLAGQLSEPIQGFNADAVDGPAQRSGSSRSLIRYVSWHSARFIELTQAPDEATSVTTRAIQVFARLHGSAAC